MFPFGSGALMPLTLLITTGGAVSVTVTAISRGGGHQRTSVNTVNALSEKEESKRLDREPIFSPEVKEKMNHKLNESDLAWEYILLLPEGKTLCGADTAQSPFHFNSEIKEEYCERDWMKKHKTSSKNQPEIWLKAKNPTGDFDGDIKVVGTNFWFSQFMSYLWHQEIVPKQGNNSYSSYSCDYKEEEDIKGNWRVRHCTLKSTEAQTSS